MGNHSGSRPTRRDLAVQGAVAVVSTGVAWSAPRVSGLSLRPDHAAAQSGPVGDTGPGTIVVDGSGAGASGLPGGVDVAFRTRTVRLAGGPTSCAVVPGACVATYVEVTLGGNQPDRCSLSTVSVDTEQAPWKDRIDYSYSLGTSATVSLFGSWVCCWTRPSEITRNLTGRANGAIDITWSGPQDFPVYHATIVCT